MPGFIAVHVGAGYHAERLRPQYKDACTDSCNSAMDVIKIGGQASDAITAALTVLEDCPLTNAGVGSNLSLKGTIECDAGIMDGKSLHFGSVGALPNIKNPIKVANKVLLTQKKGLLSGGRIPPCTIVGKGALDWALENGFELTQEDELKTASTVKAYNKNLPLTRNDADAFPLDTVGAVCMDSFGNVSAGVSSGGLILKHPARIGQACVYGAGCWAQNADNLDTPSIACSVSGVGEYLIKTLLAKQTFDSLASNDESFSVVRDVFRENFLNSPYIKNCPSKQAGMLTMKFYPVKNLCDIGWVHNTRTMIIGYMGFSDKQPTTVVSIQPDTSISESEQNIVFAEKCYKI